MKTKIALLFIALYSGITCMLGQDIMTLRTGEELEVIVTEVGKYEVWYKKFSNPDGPVYSLPVADIFMIKYPSGDKDVFDLKKSAQPQPQPQYTPTYYSRKDPGVACLLSFILPGGGQYYNGETGKGALMTMISLVSAIGMIASVDNMFDYNGYYYNYNDRPPTGLVFCAFVYLGNSLWSIIDAPVSASKINERNRLLSWNVGKKANLSLRPDINLASYSPTGSTMLSPNYGAKLTLSLR